MIRNPGTKTPSELNAKLNLNLVTKALTKIHSGQTNFEIQICKDVLSLRFDIRFIKVGPIARIGQASVVQRKRYQCKYARIALTSYTR